MGAPARDRQAVLEEARAAHRKHRYDVAYASLRSAQEAAPLDPEDLQLLADAAWWLGLITECLRFTEQVHRSFVQSGSIDRAAAQALDLASMLAMRGEHALASGWLSRARRLLLGRPPGRAHGLLIYQELAEHLDEWRLDDAAEAARRLRSLGDGLGDETLTALALLGSGLTDLRRGQIEPGFAQLDEAMLPVVAGTVAPDWAGHIYCTIVSACLDLAELNRAREWSAAAERWLTGFSDAVMFNGVCRSHSVSLLLAEGALKEAEREAQRVSAELRELNIAAVAEAEYQCGESHRLRQRFDEATACYDRAERLGREPEPGRSLLLLMTDDVDAAWSSIDDAVSRSSPEPFRCARLLRAQVQIGVAAGRLNGASSAAQGLRRLADQFRSPGFRAWADHAAGEVSLAEGRAEDATRLLDKALLEHRRLRAWYDAAVVQLLLADAYLLAHDPIRSEEHRGAAEAAFRRLGVPLPVAATARGTAADDAGLSQREVEVLVHVARGSSNRETAMTLSISEATVRRHLANIYLKLGVGSRTAAAAWAHEHGLVSREPR